MDNIIVSISPYTSHYFSYTKLLNDLKNKGYNIIFLINNDDVLRKFIIDLGFKSITIDNNYNYHLSIKAKDIKNWKKLYAKLRSNSSMFPYKLLLNNISKENQNKYIFNENNYCNKSDSLILEGFNSLINDINLYAKTKEHYPLPQKSYSYKRLNFIPEKTTIGKNRITKIRIFNQILLKEIIFPQLIKQPFYYRFYSNNNLLFRVIRGLFEKFVLYQINRAERFEVLKEFYYGEKIKPIIKQYKPELYICENFTSNYLFLMRELDIPVIELSGMCFNEKMPNYPPLFSKYIPQNHIFSYLIVNYLWFKLLVRKNIVMFINNCLDFSGQRKLNKTINHFHKIHKHVLIKNRTLGKGFKDVHELILNVKDFELPFKQKLRQTVHYIGPYIHLNRKASDFNWDDVKLNQYLIYCAFGSGVFRKMKNIIRFYNKLIQLCSKNSKYTLIISLGDKISIERLSNTTNNIYIYKWTPQIEILKKADLMITHGGMNSVKECIYTTVPMLVYPLFADQYGNSARIVYHHLGLRGNIKRESSKHIAYKINTILTNPLYKNNLKKMRDVYIKYDNANSGVEFLESFIARKDN